MSYSKFILSYLKNYYSSRLEIVQIQWKEHVRTNDTIPADWVDLRSCRLWCPMRLRSKSFRSCSPTSRECRFEARYIWNVSTEWMIVTFYNTVQKTSRQNMTCILWHSISLNGWNIILIWLCPLDYWKTSQSHVNLIFGKKCEGNNK